MAYNHLYVLSCKDGEFYKIGVCKENNIQRRIDTLQTGNPYSIELVWSEERLNANKAERYLHRCFNENRMKGEWFRGITLNEIRSKLMMFHDQD